MIMMIVILFLMIAMLMLMAVTCLRSSFPLTKSLSLLWASLNIRISQKPPIRKIIRISKIITVSNKIISTTKQSASAQPQFLPHPGQFFSAHLENFVCYLFCLFSLYVYCMYTYVVSLYYMFSSVCLALSTDLFVQLSFKKDHFFNIWPPELCWIRIQPCCQVTHPYMLLARSSILDQSQSCLFVGTILDQSWRCSFF